MSQIKYTKDDLVRERKGDFYDISGCYTTPRGLLKHLKDYGDMHNDPMFAALEGDVDELMNKPRRFFDHLLSIMEYKRDHDPMIDEGNHREYWQHIIRGCELWLSAVENGLYSEAIKLAEPMPSEQAKHKKMREFYD